MDEKLDFIAIDYQAIFDASLENKKHLLERILDAEPGTVYIYDLIEQRNVYVNRHWLTTFGYTDEEMQAMGADLIRIFHPDDLSRIAANHDAWRVASDGETRTIEYRVRNKAGEWHWLTSHETPFTRDGGGQVSQVLGIAYDVTERKRAETLLAGQNQVLEVVAAGADLPETLTALVRCIEDLSPGMLASILLMDEDGVHVRHGAAPNLPAEFVAAVDGQPIGPIAGSCGTAAYRKEAVFVEDINTDPLWEKYKAAALPHGLRAGWSAPIFDAQERVLGTFAMYYRKPGLPKPEHLRLLDAATHIASIAISRHAAELALRESEARLLKAQRVAHMGFLEWNLKTNQIFCSDEVYAMCGIEREKASTGPEFVATIVHPDDLDYVQRNLDLAARGLKQYNIDHRIKCLDGKVLWVHAQAELTSDADGKAGVLLGTIVDITERKTAEDKVQRLTQLYAALSQCNQAIVRCANATELLPQICRDAVNFGGMRMAWIGMIDKTSNLVMPVASFGAGIAYLDGLAISTDVGTPTGRGPTSTAIHSNQPFWCQDFQHDSATAPWHEQGVKFGWGASASLPLHCKNVVIGAFNLYADAENFFDQAAQNLLVEMAMDISFALDRFANETERKHEQNQLSKLSQVVEQSHNVILITDLNANIEYVNPAFAKMTGYSPAEVIGKNPRLLKSDKTPHTTFSAMWAHLNCGENWQGEIVNKRKDDTEYIMAAYISPMSGTDGRVSHYLSVGEDITERKRTEERIQYLANFDALTGLPNRAQLEDHFRYALSRAKRSEGSLVLMFLDLDQFKGVNDSLGHSVGDALLVEVAKRLRRLIREEDTVTRLGGDEFIFLLPGADASGAMQVAQKLRESLSQPCHIRQYDLSITASIGIAVYPGDGVDLETLSQSADTAMYRAKQSGRDGYRFFTAEMQACATRHMQLVNALRQALERDQLEVHYQPQVCIQDRRIVGLEALLRWSHPELGMVLPSEFIPIAEECGQILPIGEWVLRTAVKQLRHWMDNGYPPMVIAVNLSAVQFRHPSLPDLVSSILDEAQLPAEYLELELTEGVAMYDPQGAISVMNNLHERGIRMSIDDFGSGYSSLNYLKKFRVYKLKIDQSFVRDISTDLEDKAIVEAIISMAKSLGLQTIAEGVETAEQQEFLRERGCNEAQGYYYSKPLPASQIEAFFVGVTTPAKCFSE